MEHPIGNDPLIGAKVGNYEVRHKLGEGGMGSVYMAEHPLIGKKVALKVLHAEFSSNEDVVSRFFHEAKAVNDIGHPNIVDIIDYGTIGQADGSSMVYFIMEFLDGKSLAQLIREQAPLAPEQAIKIAIQIADALGASHRANIVHRDLKPDNVILLKKRHEPNFVKVLDFGIAKLTGDQPGSRRTRTGIVMGTPAYMSPEQCEGRGEVDHRTDIYALGILLYEMLTGKVPFEGEGYGEVLVQHLTQPPARPTTIRSVIPAHVEAICLRALEKRPEDRYPSMDEFIRALTDPVSYVNAAGGVDYFTSANLGAPQLTPYPAGHAPPTPLPGQLASVSPTPMPQQQPSSWPTPVPIPQTAGSASKLPLILVGLVALIGLGLGVVMLSGSGKGGKGDGNEVIAKVPLDASATESGKVPVPVIDASLSTIKATAKDAGLPIKVTPDAAGKVDKPDTTLPSQPTMVEVSIATRPSRAKVYRVGSSKLLGKTPLVLPLKIALKNVRLVLKRHKYEDRQIDVNLSKGDVSIDVSLKKKSRNGSGKPKGDNGTGSTYEDPNETLNPFGK